MPEGCYRKLIEELHARVLGVLEEKGSALVAVIGRNGSGKSHFGRYVRKRGIGSIGRGRVAVIDDGTLFVDFMRFFHRRVKVPTTGVDELAPFMKLLSGRGKDVIVYINATPERRIARADILLRIETDEETRRQRLMDRYREEPGKFEKYFNREETDSVKIGYTHLIEGKA